VKKLTQTSFCLLIILCTSCHSGKVQITIGDKGSFFAPVATKIEKHETSVTLSYVDGTILDVSYGDLGQWAVKEGLKWATIISEEIEQKEHIKYLITKYSINGVKKFVLRDEKLLFFIYGDISDQALTHARALATSFKCAAPH